MLHPTLPDDTPTTANGRYVYKSLGTWSSASDVDVFLSRFTHANDYKDGDTELALGNYVTIQDGTYNAKWMIAGFDMEHNQTAADGTVYDNGLGICMIPVIHVTNGHWNYDNTINGGYNSSIMNTAVLPGIVTNLQNILGSHIVERNVLLSNNCNSAGSYSYNWTTAYATLMNVGQMTGTFASHQNKYDDGEANYKLPIFDNMTYSTGYNFWLRGILHHANAYYVSSNGEIGSMYFGYAGGSYYVRPLIYLR